jgi:hypothetical protein
MRIATMGAMCAALTLVMAPAMTFAAPARVLPSADGAAASPPQSARQQSADRRLTGFYFDRERDAKGERAQGDRHLAQTVIGPGCAATEARFVGRIPRGANLYVALCETGGRQWVRTWAGPNTFCDMLTDAARDRGGRFACEPNPPVAQ